MATTHKLPGLNLSIIHKNNEEAHYTTGYSDLEEQIPLETNDVFFSGSIGKTYAVALLMQLVDKGKVDLNRRVKDYFPTTVWLDKLPNMATITVANLLEHSSGLPRWIMSMEVWQKLHESPNKVWSYKDRFAYIFDTEAIHPSGKGWAYSDTNYLLIGMLIEKVSGKGYYDLVRSELLSPFNLKQTYPSESRIIPNLSMAYSKLPEAFKIPNKVINEGKYVFNPQVEWSGGGMASTTSDLAKWAKIYYEGQVFSKVLLNQITTINANGTKVHNGHSYGMGSFIYHTKNGEIYGHSGFMPGYNSIFAYYPKQEIAVALQCNCDYAASSMDLVNSLELLMAPVINTSPN